MILKGRNAIVTGSTSGIGLGMATALAEAGANVMINGLGSETEIAEATKKVGAAGTTKAVARLDPRSGVKLRESAELGIHPSLIKRRLRSGQWIRLAPGVYGLSGHPDTWNQRLWVVYLAAGEESCVSHEAAVAPLRLAGLAHDVLAVTVPHPRHLQIGGAALHFAQLHLCVPFRHCVHHVAAQPLQPFRAHRCR